MTAPGLVSRRVGRPRQCPLDVLIRVVCLRIEGARLQDICDVLNTEGVPTPGGGKHWWPSHVYRLLGTYDAMALMDDYESMLPVSASVIRQDVPGSTAVTNPLNSSADTLRRTWSAG
jgi:hypothetical protein